MTYGLGLSGGYGMGMNGGYGMGMNGMGMTNGYQGDDYQARLYGPNNETDVAQNASLPVNKYDAKSMFESAGLIGGLAGAAGFMAGGGKGAAIGAIAGAAVPLLSKLF